MNYKKTFLRILIILTLPIYLIGIINIVFYFLYKNYSTQKYNQNNIIENQSKEEPANTQLQVAKNNIFMPQNLNWTLVTSSAPWEPRDSGESFVFENKLWLIGGLNGNNNVNLENHIVKYWEAPHFNDIWNTKDGLNWEKVGEVPWGPKRSMTIAFFKNKLWMMGGWSPISGYTNDIWTSEDGIHWKKIIEKASWPPREGHTLEVFMNKLWLIGGVNYDERKTFNDVWFSEDGVSWQEVKNIPWESRWDHATEIFQDKIFLTGGMNLNNKIFNDVWSSKDGINWELLTSSAPWESRQGHCLISYKDYLWIIGRLNDFEGEGENDVWFSKDGLLWEKTISNPQWTGREDLFCEVFNDKILIFGGMDSNWKWRNDVWSSIIEKNEK